MRGIRLVSRVLIVTAVAMLWACHAAPPEVGPKPEASGVFADVIVAIDKVNGLAPETKERDADVPRDEWKLILDARQRFTLPRIVSEFPAGNDYYQPEETDTAAGDDMTAGDALDVILDAEWEEYRNLSLAILPDAPDPELVKVARESLSDFYRDLPGLMAVVPDTMRERVLHIVVLRYFNTILRAGVDPRFYMLMQSQ